MDFGDTFEPVLYLCVSKFVSIMTSPFLSRFSDFVRPNIKIVIYTHKGSVCPFVYFKSLSRFIY